MKRRGALVADTVEDIPTGYEVIIRSHGVPAPFTIRWSSAASCTTTPPAPL